MTVMLLDISKVLKVGDLFGMTKITSQGFWE
jgi:hypothetical protein